MIDKAKSYLKEHKRIALGLTAFLLFAGIALRFSLAKRGHNFDFESWLIIGDIVKEGNNVYAETWRYPYGPVWSLMLGGLRAISTLFSTPDWAFRYLIIAVLTAVDIGIWAILKKYFGMVVAFAFFLCPTSIIITGYHNQIDAMAVFFALCGVLAFGKQNTKLQKRHFVGLAFIGLSLATKHLFFLFPFWLAIRQKGAKNKAIVIAVPVLLFLLSFAPYWSGASQEITKNVFMYNSFNNAPFWYAIVPRVLQDILTPQILFFGSLIIMGFVTRKRPLLESALMYTLVLVVFSSAVANQYLITVLPAILVFYNHFFGLYIAYTTLLLAVSDAGLHSSRLANGLPGFIVDPVHKDHLRTYDLVIPILAAGFFWVYFSGWIKRSIKIISRWVRKEYRNQMDTL